MGGLPFDLSVGRAPASRDAAFPSLLAGDGWHIHRPPLRLGGQHDNGTKRRDGHDRRAKPRRGSSPCYPKESAFEPAMAKGTMRLVGHIQL